MKTITISLVFAIALSFSLSYSVAFAQEEEAHVYLIQTWKTVMPEDGTAAERDSLVSEWVEGVLKKNGKVLSSMNLRHFFGLDSRDWIVINEYETWADMVAAGEMFQELNKKKWPDEEKRAEFFRKFGKYFPRHSDQIYRELPKFGK
ncbi:MAG: hypothetical protein ACE5H0_06445 [Bacteroidota bacterium]